MTDIEKYMDLAYPFDLTIETSKEQGTVTLKLYDISHWRVLNEYLTLEELRDGQIDMLAERIVHLKRVMLD